VLVLEAVLSMRHGRDGNPTGRCDFEKGRAWYCQPGVVTLVAAVRYLDQLQRMLPPDMTVNLAEAFLSN